jgi:MOSC domain-containing protein YiiM
MTTTFTIVSINVSGKKGAKKTPVASALVREDHGIEGDAHAGFMHRQVSLLAEESIAKMQAKGLKVNPGDFAENITTRGIELTSLPIGTRIALGSGVELQVTQIGKVCHTRCEIFKQAGDCVMPKEGIFAKVLRGGRLSAGDTGEILS